MPQTQSVELLCNDLQEKLDKTFYNIGISSKVIEYKETQTTFCHAGVYFMKIVSDLLKFEAGKKYRVTFEEIS